MFSQFSLAAQIELFALDHRALTFSKLIKELRLDPVMLLTETARRGKPALEWLEEEFPLPPGEFRRVHQECAAAAFAELIDG